MLTLLVVAVVVLLVALVVGVFVAGVVSGFRESSANRIPPSERARRRYAARDAHIAEMEAELDLPPTVECPPKDDGR